MTDFATCSTCGRPVEFPYRVRVGGEVVEGCIDEAHDDHADDWHRRAEAVRIRGRGAVWNEARREAMRPVEALIAAKRGKVSGRSGR